ncbi:MAG: hypothetical protein OXL96_26490 [Candidatus Poribacteria bacterium]|nr:hypothetical protein [Candidatus Poribacteria bacterium]
MKTPSPTETGGGGDNFEDHVAAFSLSLLLMRAIPPILTDTSTVEVHLQTRHEGWRTDDILIIGETADKKLKKLAIQVKRTFTVSSSNEDSQKAIVNMWNDFHTNPQFDRSVDRLAIATLHGTTTLLRDFNSLLMCAQASIDVEDFEHRLSCDGYISKKAKSQNDIIQKILLEHTGAPVDAHLFWCFLKTINIISLDLNTPTSQTKANILPLLSLSITSSGHPLTAAENTWTKLLQCASQGRPIAKSYKRENLPTELLERHTEISVIDNHALLSLHEHGSTIRDSIRSQIGSIYTIDRSPDAIRLLDQLAEYQVVVISGAAGSGKSALAKELLALIEPSHPVLAFQSVEFASAHIDKTLASAQTTLNGKRLFALLSGHDRIVILIESVERLLEHSTRDAFAHLLQLALQNNSIQLVLTVRDYSLETVRNALLGPVALPHTVFEVPLLSDGELDQIQDEVPHLALPLQDAQLRSFLRTPYIVDMASRLDWAEGSLPTNSREFREKCWKELVRAESFTADGMPQRREKAFLNIARQRATKLCPFVEPEEYDSEALAALQRDSLIKCSPKSAALFALAHDVLEDWAILKWFDEQYIRSDDPTHKLATSISGYPAIRRSFRRWLGERFEVASNDAFEFVFRAIAREDLPLHFRDDCLASVLLSDTAGPFIEKSKPKLSDDNWQLLRQILHILRVACKESPYWLEDSETFSLLHVPAGKGWSPTLKLVADLIDDLLPEHTPLVLALVEDWAKQIDLRNYTPKGSKEAGLIVSALLPRFVGYKFDDMRKRALEVLVKIPRFIPNFGDIVRRAHAQTRSDDIAENLAEIILYSFSNVHVCRDFPSEVIALINARVRISDTDINQEVVNLGGGINMDCYFGIRESSARFFPPSALQGPFRSLLRFSPEVAVTYIVDLLNHAGDWFGNRKWPENTMEPAWQITLEIPGIGETQQWMSSRLYSLYRGATVGPHVLISALMALEYWLLERGKEDDADLETQLLQILHESNNAMATGVVASVCVAYPAKAKRAGLALLSSRDIIQNDLQRRALESSAIDMEVFSGLNPTNFFYEQERTKSNRLKHRQKDLEHLAIQMQLLPDMREDVWKIIDSHRSKLSEDTNEETRVWRLALHRMDIRGFGPMPTSKEAHADDTERDSDLVYLGPSEIEPDIQEMIDETAKSHTAIERHLQLKHRATNIWQGKNSDNAEDWGEMLLAEAQVIEQELGEPDDFCRGGPSIVAAIGIRDHLEELSENDFRWCTKQIEDEIRRHASTTDMTIRLARQMHAPDRIAASVVPILASHERSVACLDVLDLLSLALTHAVDEVQDYTNIGISDFLNDEHKELILRCAAATAYRSNLITESLKQEESPYQDGAQIKKIYDHATTAMRQAIKDGGIEFSTEIMSLDFDDPASNTATHKILAMLVSHPAWDESRQIFSESAHWLAQVWQHDKYSLTSDERRDYQHELHVLRLVANFVLRLPIKEARPISSPLTEATTTHPEKVADFLCELVTCADNNTNDCFWGLWQDIANAATDAPWTKHLENEYSSATSLVSWIFLGTYWRNDISHWKRLDHHSHLIDQVAQRFPPVTHCLLAYVQFLSMIGQKSLPESFKIINLLLEKGDTIHMSSDSNLACHLERLLQRFVYSEPYRLKSDADLRDAVLNILDALVNGGSSAAYRMRDDFVTPSA